MLAVVAEGSADALGTLSMGIQDRDYYLDKLAEARGVRRPAAPTNEYAAALNRRTATPPRSSASWAPWIAVGCLVLFALVLCAAVWIAPR